MSLRNWIQRIVATWQQPRLRRRRQRRSERGVASLRGAMIEVVEPLESRQMLAATTGVNVAVSGNSVVLTDYGRGAGDSFDITYTATLVTLTGHNGTQFRVGGSSVASHTINTTHAIDLTIVLKSHANTVHITGDGTASLASLNVNCGWRDANNAVALNKVIAGSLLIQGGRGADAVTLTASTVNGPFRVALGQNSNDSLIVDHSTVNGDMDAAAGTITADHATFGGRVAANQSGRDNTFDTTASTFNHDFRDRLGPDAVVNFHPSTDGANKFHGQADLIGRRRHHATLNTTTTAATFDAGRDFIRVDARLVAGPTAPVVTSQTVEVAPATVSGTFDSVQAPSLAVTVGTKTFTLGTDSQLTSPSAGKWSLSLTGTTLPAGATTVTAVSSDTFGNHQQGTGTITITNGPANSIQAFVTANHLTAIKTASGLNYVITTPATGALPTANQLVSANYSGFLLNADGTLGTEFDSNVHSQFNHVQPFQFRLGQHQVIAGWDEAFALLPVGTSAKLLIPPALGYGSTARPGIPANSILVFDVKLLSAT